MKIFIILKNDKMFTGDFYSLPELALDSLFRELSREYSNLNYKDIYDDMKNVLIKKSHVSLVAGRDIWTIQTYKKGSGIR